MGKTKWLQIGVEFFFTADFAEFLPLIGKFDAIQIATPLVVERAKQLLAADNPEFVVVQNNLIGDRM